MAVGSVMGKPTFGADQLVSSSDATRNFGKLRKKAKNAPQFITDNGTVDTVILDYKYYEHLYTRLMELEEAEEARILRTRIDRLEKDPSVGVPWHKARRSVDVNE